MKPVVSTLICVTLSAMTLLSVVSSAPNIATGNTDENAKLQYWYKSQGDNDKDKNGPSPYSYQGENARAQENEVAEQTAEVLQKLSDEMARVQFCCSSQHIHGRYEKALIQGYCCQDQQHIVGSYTDALIQKCCQHHFSRYENALDEMMDS